MRKRQRRAWISDLPDACVWSYGAVNLAHSSQIIIPLNDILPAPVDSSANHSGCVFPAHFDRTLEKRHSLWTPESTESAETACLSI